MVRKIIVCLMICVLLVGATCTQANASSHQVYEEGTIGTTYITYFKDIISGIGFNDDYVAFRSGQYDYTMIVGELSFDNGYFYGNGKEYVFTSSSGYNSQATYSVNDISDFSLSVDNSIIYSNLGDYPELVERGAKYEMLSAVLLCIIMLSAVIRRIFFRR